MPYIKASIRQELAGGTYLKPRNSGELAYKLCEQIQHFLETVPNGGYEGALSKVLGAIEAARIAFVEDVYKPYEVRKHMENGPVFNWPPK